MPPKLNIAEVVLSRELINDSDISVAQLTALKSAYGLPLAGEELDLYRRATEKSEYVPSERREDIFLCGRRSGKDDKLCANIAIFEGAFREHKLSRGEHGYVLLLAATAAQAKICFGYILGKMQSSALLSATIAAVRDDEIALANGVTISVIPANFRTIRGRSVVCAICSEIAFWFDSETCANPAREILRALRPSMATFKDAKLVMASSPWAKTGVLWEMYSKRHSWFGNRLVWRLDSLTMMLRRKRHEGGAGDEGDLRPRGKSLRAARRRPVQIRSPAQRRRDRRQRVGRYPRRRNF